MAIPPAAQPPGTARIPRSGVLRLMVQPRIVRAALKLALVVGTVLNLINNGEQLWVHHTVDLWHLALNYVVPFCVSSYSAARQESTRPRGTE